MARWPRGTKQAAGKPRETRCASSGSEIVRTSDATRDFAARRVSRSRRVLCPRTAMSSGSRFAFRPFRQSERDSGAQAAPNALSAAARQPPKLSFFRQSGAPRPKTSAEHVVEVKEEPMSVEDDGDVLQYSSTSSQEMMPPPPPSTTQRSRFHVSNAHAAYSPASAASTESMRSAFVSQNHGTHRKRLNQTFDAHILIDSSRFRSCSCTGYVLPAWRT